ncbi:MAG: glycosyltransferase family 4 protein [Candidatus Omnitrophota bacterium]|jgi:glycosyltransferase involved in cell wall biosynthesis
MRVLHVNTHMNIGGIGQYILSLCCGLKAQGVECMVASSGGGLESELKDNGLKHLYVDLKTKFEFGPKVFKAVPVLAGIIEREKIDIIHAHSRVSQVASALALRRPGIHYVSTCHGFFKPRLSRKIYDTWGEKVVAISNAVKAHLEKDFGVKPERIELIHNGIDVKRFSTALSDDEIAGLKNVAGLGKGPVVGTMARLSPVKGQRFLIEAMKRVVSKNGDVQCLIVGSGPEETALKALSMNSGLGNHIKFTGFLHKTAPLYLACMDIFVLPSIEEGLGIALLEAMASGKPCIASNVGGITDIIKDGENGILVPAGDDKAIADALSTLLYDKELRADLGGKGRKSVEKDFTLPLMAEKMKSLYTGVLNA